MSILGQIIADLTGDVHFYVEVGNKPAAEIKLNGKEVLVEIKNPLLAAEAGIKQLMTKGSSSINLEKLKKMGYKIRIKYGPLEVDL